MFKLGKIKIKKLQTIRQLMFEVGKMKIENYNKTLRQLMFEVGKIKIKKL